MKRWTWLAVVGVVLFVAAKIVFAEFEAKEPQVIPAVAEKQYDKIWMSQLIIQSESPATPVRAMATFLWYKTTTNGVEVGSQTKAIVIEDLYTAAATNASLGTALQMVMDAIKRLAVDNGIVKE